LDDRQIQQLAHEIANQTAFHNWEYWLTLLAVAFIAALGGYFGSYFAKRGEHAANKADLDKILDQVEKTTRMTAGIESVVSLGEWSERERRMLRRVKLDGRLSGDYPGPNNVLRRGLRSRKPICRNSR
jgi:hypothetical protein